MDNNIDLKEVRFKLSKRHIFKTVSWRLIGTLDTLILSWVITGDFLVGFKISTIEVVSKMVLYYFHERFGIILKFQIAPSDIFIKLSVGAFGVLLILF